MLALGFARSILNDKPFPELVPNQIQSGLLTRDPHGRLGKMSHSWAFGLDGDDFGKALF